MAVRLFSAHVSFDVGGIDLDAFPAVMEQYLLRTRHTLELEGVAMRLVQRGFPEDDTAHFVRAVCRWGGYPGIAGRVLKSNDAHKIRRALLGAVDALAEGDGHAPRRALESINAIRGLGTPSFASKHLRFLDPATCPVLDRLVARNYGYPLTPHGYELYATDCGNIARALRVAGKANPVPTRTNSWAAADVDAVLFALIKSWTPGGLGTP
ncbi:MAG: hypothetical protein AAGU73_03585 [Actinomycetota bacterium]